MCQSFEYRVTQDYYGGEFVIINKVCVTVVTRTIDSLLDCFIDQFPCVFVAAVHDRPLVRGYLPPCLS
jgi:hypothetical protein